MARTQEIAIQAQESNSALVWQLANILVIIKRTQRLAVAPIVNSDGTIAISKEHLSVLWTHQCAADFAGQVAGMAPSQMSRLLEERQSQSLGPVPCDPPLYHTSSGLPHTSDEWLDFVQARLPNLKKGKQVGLDCIPNEIYIAAGKPSQLQVSRLLHSATTAPIPYLRKSNSGTDLDEYDVAQRVFDAVLGAIALAKQEFDPVPAAVQRGQPFKPSVLEDQPKETAQSASSRTPS